MPECCNGAACGLYRRCTVKCRCSAGAVKCRCSAGPELRPGSRQTSQSDVKADRRVKRSLHRHLFAQMTTPRVAVTSVNATCSLTRCSHGSNVRERHFDPPIFCCPGSNASERHFKSPTVRCPGSNVRERYIDPPPRHPGKLDSVDLRSKKPVPGYRTGMLTKAYVLRSMADLSLYSLGVTLYLRLNKR